MFLHFKYIIHINTKGADAPVSNDTGASTASVLIQQLM